MGFYQRLILKQSCVLCFETAKFCVCRTCESSFVVNDNRCFCCAVKLSSNLSFCGECLSRSPAFSKTCVLYDYSHACAQLIKQFKFNHQLCIGDYFAHQLHSLYRSIIKENGNYAAIIPLPLSRARIKERGYNQTHELLRIIAKNTNTIIDTKSVRRIKTTQPLSSLNLEQGKKEIKGAFSAQVMSYKKVLLVGDVMTTDSSLNEMVKTLIKAGVECCDVLILARA
ncbi:phosphoribosyltransferase [Abyssogena phaseoliformis symbiont OG214]|nr:phosphoribosyltransferase [Abyssogena phaseoliformis symbiont OG214]